MACNCNKKDDSLPGSDPATWSPKPSFNIMKWLPIILILLAIGWFFFLKSKGPQHHT